MRHTRSRISRTVAVGILAYLGGSLPIVYFLGRLAGVDLRRYGSGNVGSANLSSAAGLGVGLVGWLSDVAKGYLAVLATCRFTQDDAAAGGALLGALAGQCWPAFLRWSGGRGVATLVGGMLALTPRAAPWPLGAIAALAGLRPLARTSGGIGAALHRSAVPIGVLVGVLVWPLACWRDPPSRHSTLPAATAALLLVVRRITANGWLNPPVSAVTILRRALLDRDQW